MKKTQVILNIIIIIWLSHITALLYEKNKTIVVKASPDTIYIKEEIRFDTMQATVHNMYKVCDSLGIKYPKIVVSQAILESGNFKSKLFKTHNNPLGLYDSKNNRYYKFNHWTDALTAYQNMIEYKHKDNENYYDFLKRIGYAEDNNYINKVKSIESKLKH